MKSLTRSRITAQDVEMVLFIPLRGDPKFPQSYPSFPKQQVPKKDGGSNASVISKHHAVLPK